MKKDYIKPEIHLEEFLIESLMLVETSTTTPDGSEEDDGFAKDRNNEGGSSWGDLW